MQSEENESQVKALCSLVDKMTPRLFLKACQERGDAIMEFIGPEIEENGGNVKKAIETVGDYVSDVVWNDILDQAGLSHTKSNQWVTGTWLERATYQYGVDDDL